MAGNALGYFVPASNNEFRRKWRLSRLTPVHPEDVESLRVARIFTKQTRNPCMDCRSKFKPCFQVVCIKNLYIAPRSRHALVLCPILLPWPASRSDEDEGC